MGLKESEIELRDYEGGKGDNGTGRVKWGGGWEGSRRGLFEEGYLTLKIFEKKSYGNLLRENLPKIFTYICIKGAQMA